MYTCDLRAVRPLEKLQCEKPGVDVLENTSSVLANASGNRMTDMTKDQRYRMAFAAACSRNGAERV